MTAGNSKQRILVMSHAHPDFSTGGGEIAAHSLFKAYQSHPEIDSAWFLAAADRTDGITGRIRQRWRNEFLWEQSVNDWHRIKAIHQDSVTTVFADLIRALRPTVVHTHHYAHLGLEYLQVIKQIDPTIKIVMTLHDYIAICEHNGQMIKVASQKLCIRSSPADCRRCFPDRSPEDFWLRERRIKHYFSFIDQFVSPSEFLRQRYIEWGLPPEKIAVIENGQATTTPVPPRPLADGETRNRFAYFGQINPFKGLTVLLEALQLLVDTTDKKIILEVHGANLDLQVPSLKNKIKELADPLMKKGVVQWVGSYRPDELRARMAKIDWLVIPSIWWENSPMVIQEAFMHGRPVIGSDIGGMKEKIRDGVDGLHVSVSNVLAWADILSKASEYDKEWDLLRKQIREPINHAECVNRHLQLLN